MKSGSLHPNNYEILTFLQQYKMTTQGKTYQYFRVPVHIKPGQLQQINFQGMILIICNGDCG